MKMPRTALWLGLILLGLTTQVHAKHDDDDDDDRGRGRGHGREHGNMHGPKVKSQETDEFYKYEYKDGSCRYKYMYNYKSGKSHVNEKGNCRGVALPSRPIMVGAPPPPPRVIPPAPRNERISCNRDVIGAVIGGAIGAVIGKKVGNDDNWIITTAGGAVIGAVIGGVIGRQMDRSDHACMGQALEYAQLNQSVTWDNPDQKSNYTVTPLESYQNAAGLECRKYVLKTVVVGQPQNQTGNACRQANGAWQPAS